MGHAGGQRRRLLPAGAAAHAAGGTPPTAALGPGLLGGFTTLSAYAEEARGLVADGRAGLAAAYVLGTLAACLLAVAAARLRDLPEDLR